MMKKILLAVLILVGVSTSWARDWKEKVADESLRKTVVIDIYGVIEASFFGISLGTMPVHGFCSGVFIDSKGSVLTAAHCFQGNSLTISSITVTALPWQVRDVSKNTLFLDSDSDLAIIMPPTVRKGRVPYARISKQKRARIAQDVLTVGHPLGLYWTVTTGIVSGAVRELFPHGFFTQFDAVIAPGSSGGPVFDRTGRLLGIMSRYRGGPMGSLTGLNFMVEVNSLREFLTSVKRLVSLEKKIRRYRIGDVR